MFDISLRKYYVRIACVGFLQWKNMQVRQTVKRPPGCRWFMWIYMSSAHRIAYI